MRRKNQKTKATLLSALIGASALTGLTGCDAGDFLVRLIPGQDGRSARVAITPLTTGELPMDEPPVYERPHIDNPVYDGPDSPSNSTGSGSTGGLNHGSSGSTGEIFGLGGGNSGAGTLTGGQSTGGTPPRTETRPPRRRPSRSASRRTPAPPPGGGLLGQGGSDYDDVCPGGYTGLDGNTHCMGDTDYGADHQLPPEYADESSDEPATESSEDDGSIVDFFKDAYASTIEKAGAVWDKLQEAAAEQEAAEEADDHGCYEDDEAQMTVCPGLAD